MLNVIVGVPIAIGSKKVTSRKVGTGFLVLIGVGIVFGLAC